jgi:isopenicillin-N epimerase
VVAAVTGALTGRTRLLVVDHVASSTARVLPAARIAAAARAAGVPVLVDAAHAPGNLAAVEADFWVGNFHKWAYAPRGTALLVVAPGWRERIRPLVVSWQEPQGFPWSVEWQGTQDYTPWLAAPIGLFTLRSLGLDAVRAHNAALAAYGQRVVGAALGLDAASCRGTAGSGHADARPAAAGRPCGGPGRGPWRCSSASPTGSGPRWGSGRGGGRGLLRLSAQVYNRATSTTGWPRGYPLCSARGSSRSRPRPRAASGST